MTKNRVEFQHAANLVIKSGILTPQINSPLSRLSVHPHIMRTTKIICTLGPATDSLKVLREMILAGTNIFRLNMSHGTHEWVREVVKNIRTVSADLGAVTAILLDTQGPAIARAI